MSRILKIKDQIINAHTKVLSTLKRTKNEKENFNSIWHYVVDKIHNLLDSYQLISACVDTIHVYDRINLVE